MEFVSKYYCNTYLRFEILRNKRKPRDNLLKNTVARFCVTAACIVFNASFPTSDNFLSRLHHIPLYNKDD